jgi:hypothetical protein
MAEPERSPTENLRDDLMVMMQALVNIAQESEEADVVRIAVGALQRTESGVEYLSMNHLVI